jgi:hypothetical protein
MDYTVAQTMDVVAGHVPGALVDADAWRVARAVAARLPAACARGFYLECRLSAASPSVDWIVRVDETGRDALAGRGPGPHLPPDLRADPVWQRVARFCAEWSDDPRLRRTVTHLWLEFDLDGDAPPVPRPSVFAAFDQQTVAGLADDEWAVLLDQVLRHLGPEVIAPATRRALHTAVARRPPGAQIPYVGSMLARPVQPVRLYLAWVPAPRLPGALHEMGWPGAPGELSALLERMDGPIPGAAPDTGMAHLDVDGEVLPRVGVEFTFRRVEQLRGTLVEAPFLEHLVSLGLCADGKRKGLLAWPGHEIVTLPHELWPSVVARRVNCVKLLHDPGQAPQAKGYLLTRWAPASRRARGVVEAGVHDDANPGSID